MLKVGITGGIGSGKSIVAKLFELVGVPVYYADDAAKKLMNENAAIREQLIREFGAAAYNNNVLDRAWLAAIVFNNKQQLELLNSIVHPIVINEGLTWITTQKAPIVMKEAAIFFESGSNVGMDYMIGVYAPQAVRMKRVMKRDSTSKQAVLNRMSRQMDEEEKMKRCDFIIQNNETQLLIPQVIELHQHLLSLT
jgi:dephospho-CoA kinase